jgi:hypothetical protein
MRHSVVIEVCQCIGQTCRLHQTEAMWSPKVMVHYVMSHPMRQEIIDGDFQPGQISRNKRWPIVLLLFTQPGSDFYLLSLSCGFRLKASTWCSNCCLWVHWPKWQHSLVLVLYSHLWITPRPPRWQLTHYLNLTFRGPCIVRYSSNQTN